MTILHPLSLSEVYSVAVGEVHPAGAPPVVASVAEAEVSEALAAEVSVVAELLAAGNHYLKSVTTYD